LETGTLKTRLRDERGFWGADYIVAVLVRVRPRGRKRISSWSVAIFFLSRVRPAPCEKRLILERGENGARDVHGTWASENYR
jgi:hypothetical protein